MTAKHTHYDLIVAWAGGAEIQFLIGYSEWRDIEKPSWLPDLVYRVKPKPKVKKWYWITKTSYGYSISNLRYSEDDVKGTAGFIQKIEDSMIEVEE